MVNRVIVLLLAARPRLVRLLAELERWELR